MNLWIVVDFDKISWTFSPCCHSDITLPQRAELLKNNKKFFLISMYNMDEKHFKHLRKGPSFIVKSQEGYLRVFQ